MMNKDFNFKKQNHLILNDEDDENSATSLADNITNAEQRINEFQKKGRLFQIAIDYAQENVDVLIEQYEKNKSNLEVWIQKYNSLYTVYRFLENSKNETKIKCLRLERNQIRFFKDICLVTLKKDFLVYTPTKNITVDKNDANYFLWGIIGDQEYEVVYSWQQKHWYGCELFFKFQEIGVKVFDVGNHK